MQFVLREGTPPVEFSVEPDLPREQEGYLLKIFLADAIMVGQRGVLAHEQPPSVGCRQADIGVLGVVRGLK